MRNLRVFGRLLALSLLIAGASGCTERVVEGDVISHQFAGWMGGVLIAAGCVGLPLGVWLWRRSKRWESPWAEKIGFVMTFLAPAVLAFGAPAMYLDKVVVDSKHFSLRTGFWFDPTLYDVAFADLSVLRVVPTYDGKGRRKVTLLCVARGGAMVPVPVGTLMRYAVNDILAKAQDAGLKVSIETELPTSE